MSEEEISMVLDTYMYLDYKEADDGMSMEEILQELSSSPDCQAGGLHYGEYQILSKAAENPEIGSLIIDNQSHLMGYDSGTAACSFRAPDGSCTYIVYRGTADGEWPDNGIGMTEESTIQQERALSYFETSVERLGITKEERLIVTGHSKGGNKAQYVTMSTRHGELLDICYNVDGQGFSQEAIDAWKGKHGEAGYEERRNKIVGIYGENDYVNVLGYSIVPEENVHYVKTPVEKSNFAGYHDIKYMFSNRVQNPETGTWETEFYGEPNDYALKRGILGNYAAELSASVMELPEWRRDGCAAVIMHLMEATRGSVEGINREKLSLLDVDDFLTAGTGLIRDSIFLTGSGLCLLDGVFGKDSLVTGMQGNVNFGINGEKLKQQAEELEKLALLIKKEKDSLSAVTKELPLVMKGSFGIKWKLAAQERELSQLEKALCRLADQLTEITNLYRECDGAVSIP